MKKKILIISIIVLVITLIGSTYAFFMYSKTLGAFTLTSGDINIEFVNGDNNINLTYAYPISDNYAKANLEKLGYIDFSVNGKITEDKKVINYEIYLEEDSKNTLDSNYIKVYLTDDTNKEIISPKTYNSLDKTTYSNSDNGKVIYKTSKHGEFNDKYRIYIWIDSKYSQNIIQERFSFKVNLYAYNDTETAVSVIKSKLVKYAESSKDDFQGGLVAVNTDGELYNETDPSESIREYRYSGPNVDNYVTFNNEAWRIIGVFKEGNEEFLKIVRNEYLKSDVFPLNYNLNDSTYQLKEQESDDVVFWNNNNGENTNINDWSKAGLMYFLNTDKDNLGQNGYQFYLSNDAKNMIRETIYYLGNVTFLQNDTCFGIDEIAISAYKNERATTICPQEITYGSQDNNCYIWYNNSITWKGKVGLMYLSDIAYSSNSINWSTAKLLSDQREKSQSSWIKNSFIDKVNETIQFYWLISPASSTNYFASAYRREFDNYIFGDRHVPYSLNDRSLVHPTLYLKSNVKIISGDGSQNNQYKLSLD